MCVLHPGRKEGLREIGIGRRRPPQSRCWPAHLGVERLELAMDVDDDAEREEGGRPGHAGARQGPFSNSVGNVDQPCKRIYFSSSAVM
jgi:hypothetical protein